jgi:protein ImuA
LPRLKPGTVLLREYQFSPPILKHFSAIKTKLGVRLSMTSSRRLQLAAEGSGTIGLAIRRWRRPAEVADFGHPTASITRWRVSALPATPLPVPGVGRPRWQLELIRCRAGESADFEVEACDAKGRLALPSAPVHGEKDIGRRRASG